MEVEKHVIALGGGGFSTEPDNPLLDLFILEVAKKARGRQQPKVCFIPTASGDSPDYIDRFYKAFRKLPASPTHLSLFRGKTPDLASVLFGQDVLYIGGGNTRNMLALWREWGLDLLIRSAYEQGIVMAGISAGSICWFQQGVTDSIPGALNAWPCLGILEGSNCPHYDSETARRPSYQRLLQEGKILPGMACDDGAALHFKNGALVEAVSSRPEAKSYRLGLEGDGVQGRPRETPLTTRYLGGKAQLIRRAAPSDALGLHEAHMRSIREVCSKDHSPEEIGAWSGRVFNEEQRLRVMREGAVWVVEEKGKIEGYAGLIFHGEEAELIGMYLTPNVLGQGLGRRLFSLVEEEARSRQCGRLVLSSTITACGFYQHMGAVCSGPMTLFPINGHQVRCFPMVKAL